MFADLSDPLCISGCRALGLIDKLVTGPLWRRLSDSSTSVLEMGSVYCEMKSKFDSWAEDADSVIRGIATLEDNSSLCADEVREALLETNATNETTLDLLKLIFGAFAETTQRLLLDHLPGGKYHSVEDNDAVEELSSVPTTNVSPERDFAVLDRLMREKPNASNIALESMILYSRNKTASWLQQKEPEKRQELLQVARTLAPAVKENFKRRKQEIETCREKALAKKQKEIEQKQLHKTQEKEKLIREIEGIGLWKSRTEVECKLKTIAKKTEKVKILKLQIKYHHKVIEQTPPDTSVFKFSHNRKQHSIEQLKQNLYQLLI